MDIDHEKYAAQTPKPYEGKVTKPGTPHGDEERCSVVEAANYHNLPPILARFGDWVICKDGVHCLYTRYHVAKTRLHESDWVDHMSRKTWVNPQDFIDALEAAKTMVASEQI